MNKLGLAGRDVRDGTFLDMLITDLLIEISEMWNVNIAAYCLMTNLFLC